MRDWSVEITACNGCKSLRIIDPRCVHDNRYRLPGRSQVKNADGKVQRPIACIEAAAKERVGVEILP